MKIFNDVTGIIGGTTLNRLNNLSKGIEAEIYLKMENQNPGSSFKDPLALSLIRDAEKKGLIKSETEIIGPTSGNTGIGLAMLSAVKGYRLTLTMPESMSVERLNRLLDYGAKLVHTPPDKGMKGAITKAEELAADNPNSYMPYQFINMANIEIHSETTALEIWNDSDEKIDIFVAGVRTGGTFTDEVSKRRESNKELIGIEVEPGSSPILSGGQPGSHKILGIGTGFIHEIMNNSLIDESFKIDDSVALKTTRQLAKEEGILYVISAGANVAAAIQIASQNENKGKTIVTVICDTGERYLNTVLFNNQ